MSEDTSSSSIAHLNEPTMMAEPANLVPEAQPLGPREAFIVAHDRIRSLAEIAHAPAMIVAAVTSHHRVVDAVLVEQGRALILGRHTRCGLRLASPRIALRHVAVLVYRPEDQPAGPMIARVWDLRTGAPFLTEQGQPNEAVIADGPFFISLGGHAIWLIPSALAAGWSGSADEAWAALPPRVLIDRRPAPAGGPPAAPRLAPTTPPAREPSPHDDEEISHVTLMGPPLLLGDPEGIEIGWGAVRIEHAAERIRREISAERLERGVLVGRYDRCGLQIHRSMTSISRVHMLLVRIGADVWAIDTASTFGLWRGKDPIEASILADRDTLRLGDAATVRWQRRHHPEA